MLVGSWELGQKAIVTLLVIESICKLRFDLYPKMKPIAWKTICILYVMFARNRISKFCKLNLQCLKPYFCLFSLLLFYNEN